MTRILGRLLKIIAAITGILGTLLVVAFLLLNTDSVQNKLVKQATVLLSDKLGTKVDIQRADISLLRQSIGFYGLVLEDQQQAKLLEVKELSAWLELWPLIRNRELIVNQVKLEGVEASLSKPSDDAPANYQFVIDAFKKDKKEPKPEEAQEEKPGQKLTFDISEVSLRDVHLRYDTPKMSHQADIHRLKATSRHKIYKVEAEQLHYANDNHRPRKNAGKPKKGFFDPGHVDATINLQLVIDSLEGGTAKGEIQQLQVRDSVMGFDIRQLRAKFVANKQQLRLSDLLLQQMDTEIAIDSAHMTLPDKKTGRTLAYTTGLIKGRTFLKDISRPFAPVLQNFTIPLNLQARMSGTDNTMNFRDIHVSTDDKHLQIFATGNLTDLRDKKKMVLRFKVSKMFAKSGSKEKIIKQFPVKRMMMKQLHALGDITYKGDFIVSYKRETFKGRLHTAPGNLDFQFAIDDSTKYLLGTASTKDFNLGQAIGMDKIGPIVCKADFRIDISKPRTARMRKLKGGKLPIGKVSAVIDDCSYMKIHVRRLTADITSDGALATGNICQIGKHRDIYCSFSFTNTSEMHKMKITNAGLKFHKLSEEDKALKEKRKQEKKKEKELRKQEKARQKELKQQEREQQKEQKRLEKEKKKEQKRLEKEQRRLEKEQRKKAKKEAEG